MGRPRKAAADPFSDLRRKAAILEREMTLQRHAMDRLKEMGIPRPHLAHPLPAPPVHRRS
jgi:hypothetical protein